MTLHVGSCRKFKYNIFIFVILHCKRFNPYFGDAYHYIKNQMPGPVAYTTSPAKNLLYKRADMDGFRDHLARYRDSFLSSDHSHMSVNDMWVSFKSEVIAAIERFIPSKMTKTKYSSPWIDSLIKLLIKRRDRLYFRARKSSSPDIKSHYKRFRAHVQKVIRDA